MGLKVGVAETTMPIHALPGWRNARLRFVAKVNPGSGDARLSSEDAVSFVPMVNVGEYGGLSLDQTKPLAEIGVGYTCFADGDIVVAKITPCFENGKGALANGLTNGVAFGTTELHVVRPSSEIDGRYLFYWTISKIFRGFGEGSMYGAGGQKRVPEGFVKDFWLPLPSIQGQRSIADFLDRKTAQIDALIANKAALLHLLAEKFAAFITHAVTKGLDPAAPMKDSGVPWLGEVPAHWSAATRLKFRIKSSGGMTPSTTNPRYWNGEIPWVTPKDMKQFLIDGSIHQITELAIDEVGLQLIPEDTVLIVIRGLILAHTFPVAIPRVAVTVNQDMKALSPDARLSPLFLAHLLTGLGRHVLSLVEASAHGTKALRTEQFENLMICLPPLNEQLSIVAELGRRTGSIEEAIASTSATLDLLREYRSALITDAVTGRIESPSP